MTHYHETTTFSLPMFDDSEAFTSDLLKYFDTSSPFVLNDKQDDIMSIESDCSSFITNRHRDEMASNISTLETSATIATDDRKFYIKEHESPSTSAAAIAAAEAVTASPISNSKNSDTYPPSLLQKKNILRKSSAFFNEKILGKKTSAAVMQEEYRKQDLKETIKKKRSSGFVIKPIEPTTTETEETTTVKEVTEKPVKQKRWRSFALLFK